MLLHLRRHAIAYVALFLVLGGTSFAATKLGKGSVTNSKLARGSVTGSKIANNAVTGGKVKNGSLTHFDFRKGTLLQGPKGAKGDPGPSTGKAGGDLQGTYPNPTIKSLGAWTILSPGQCRIIADTAAWSTATKGTHALAYRVDRDGVVHMRGTVTCPKASNTSVVAGLPAAVRPLQDEYSPIVETVSPGTPAAAYTLIATDGSIEVVGKNPSAPGDFYSFNGVEFDTKH